jgi:hypothetical protein
MRRDPSLPTQAVECSGILDLVVVRLRSIAA